MHTGQHERGVTALDDLDSAASEYAAAWTEIDDEKRRALRANFISRLVPFADRLASRYRERVEPLDDLRQVARIGLIKAVDRYNPERGSFTAFAFVTITGEMKRHLRDHTWGVHVNRRLQELSIEVSQATAELSQALSRTPTAAEIARHLEVDEYEVLGARMCRRERTPVSLNTPLHSDDSREIGELMGSADTAIENVTDLLTLKRLVQELPPEIQRMIIMRFHGNLTQSQIATEFDLSQMHVSRLLRRGLAWLREAMLSDAQPPPWNHVQDHYATDTIKVQIRQTEISIHVQVAGEINMHTAARLARRLQSAISLAAAQGRLTVDLTRVHFIDETGATVLRDAQESASRSGILTAVVGLPLHPEMTAADNDAGQPSGFRW